MRTHLLMIHCCNVFSLVTLPAASVYLTAAKNVTSHKAIQIVFKIKVTFPPKSKAVMLEGAVEQCLR